MTKTILNLADIQGNILRAYGSYGYSTARYFFLHIDTGSGGSVASKGKEAGDSKANGGANASARAREFIGWLLPYVTTSQRWAKPGQPKGADMADAPGVTLNVGFTFEGLLRLGLPTRSLAAMPDEFMDGMKKRAPILGDVQHNDPRHWDEIWNQSKSVHIWLGMSARGADSQDSVVPELEERTKWLRDLVKKTEGAVTLLEGIGPDKADFQEASALFAETAQGEVPTRKEHFGFNDGYGNPVFEGQHEPEVEAERVIGRGKLQPDQTWKPLATGEFLLGHADESQQLPVQSRPWELTHNGTFMVYRKLHQNVGSFKDYMGQEAKKYASVMGVPEDEAEATIKAKMIGRWEDGIPLMVAPSFQEWKDTQAKWKGKTNSTEYRRMLMDFTYGDDREGARCPVTAHMRRSNTRDTLDPALAPGNEGSPRNGSALNKRRRILRRGLPYGSPGWEDQDDEGEHGIIFIAVCSSIFRQFEFVQQQWIQYGLDFNAGNDTCPIIGNHGEDAKFVIPASPTADRPYICSSIPNFVTTRGGDYFFMPSMSALNMIAKGTVDPT